MKGKDTCAVFSHQKSFCPAQRELLLDGLFFALHMALAELLHSGDRFSAMGPRGG